MSDIRHPALTTTKPRPVEGVLPQNRAYYKDIYDIAVARDAYEGQEDLLAGFDKAIAAGEPGLMAQQLPNYITQEALVRSFATSFGIVVNDGAPDQVPEFTFPVPDMQSISIYSVAVSGGRAGSRRRRRYTITEPQVTGSWKEIQTEPVEVDTINPFFARKRALLEAQAADELAYFFRKELDNIAWTAVTASIAAFGSNRIWTLKDTDVIGLPTTNTYTSAKNFFPTLREKVLPHFMGFDAADQVINVFYLHTDAQYIYQLAAVGTQGLGSYTLHQEKVYEGNIRDIAIYGHRFRLIPVNWKITSGTLYANVGPVFKMWLPPTGNQVITRARADGSQYRVLSRIYEILSPTVWYPNVMYSTWSTSNFTDG